MGPFFAIAPAAGKGAPPTTPAAGRSEPADLFALDARLVDKLELVIDELEHEGYHVGHLAIMSGFRTPRYNQGGGETNGRASLSRHKYGDATDVFVDNDRDGWTDDVNRDGRVDIRDAEVVGRAAERAEARHPAWWAGWAYTGPLALTGPSLTWTCAGGGPAGGGTGSG